MTEESFTPTRPPRSVRFVAGSIAVLAVLLGFWTTLTSSSWVGRTFPGLLVLENGTIASAMLPHWSGRAERALFQSRIATVDGLPVTNPVQVYQRAAECRPGQGGRVRYALESGGTVRERAIACQRFTLGDWVALFGFFLLNGMVFLVSGARRVDPASPSGRGAPSPCSGR